MELWTDGSGRLTIQKGKNQVEPATVAGTPTTARALREICPDDADPAAPVFGLTGETLANRARAAARAVGMDDGFTAHSGRIGMARKLVAVQGRWRHGDTVARYTGTSRQGGIEVADTLAPTTRAITPTEVCPLFAAKLPMT